MPSTRGKVARPRVLRRGGAPAFWPYLDGPRRTASGDAGDAGDLTGNFRSGSRVGGCTWGYGPRGRCLDLDGSTGYLTYAAGPTFGTAEFTVLLWVYPTSFSGEQGLYDSLVLGGTGSRNDAFVLVQTATTGKLRIYHAGGYSSTTTNGLTLNAWNVVGLYRFQTTAVFVINGGIDPTAWGAFGASLSSGGATIGRYADAAGGFFAGKVDGVQVYRRVLSLAEIQRTTADPDWRLRPATAPDAVAAAPAASTLAPLASILDRRRRAG